ncbi:MAG: winged helix-turn-helix domain-containing protein [Acidimicrobiales bacterium]
MSGRATADRGPIHPTQGIDDVVHQRVRLGILTVAHEARRVDFNYLLESLELTGGNLSQHLRVLEDAGLVKIDKVIDGRRPRTWILITRAGRRALLQEVDCLKAIVRRIEADKTKEADGRGPSK